MTASGTTGKKFKYGPDLKPFPKLSYHLTREELDDACDAQLKAHFAPKPPAPSKEKVHEHVSQHFIDMAAPADNQKDSDYVRSIKKSYLAGQKESSSSSSQAVGKKSGKTIP